MEVNMTVLCVMLPGRHIDLHRSCKHQNWEIVNEDYFQIFFTLGRNNKTDMHTMVNIPFEPFIEIVFVYFWQSLVTTIMAAITSSAGVVAQYS